MTVSNFNPPGKGGVWGDLVDRNPGLMEVCVRMQQVYMAELGHALRFNDVANYWQEVCKRRNGGHWMHPDDMKAKWVLGQLWYERVRAIIKENKIRKYHKVDKRLAYEYHELVAALRYAGEGWTAISRVVGGTDTMVKDRYLRWEEAHKRTGGMPSYNWQLPPGILNFLFHELNHDAAYGTIQVLVTPENVGEWWNETIAKGKKFVNVGAKSERAIFDWMTDHGATLETVH